MQTLTTHSLLQGGRYKIIETLGQGGFGITYLAIQSGLDRKVAVKEFFMKELCERDETTSHVTLGTEGSRETVNRFREKFLKEARNIARLNHPNIVRIIDVFEENGTAYYVMEYAENGSLADKVKREGYLSESVATRYILQIAEALNYIHQQKMNHLDVKPANIMLNEKDESVLIDFGLSKQYDAVTGSQTSTTPVGISEGYAPMEQYKQGGVGEFSPETDIYALGATFFKLLTGTTPPSASDVNEDGVPVNELQAKGVSDNAIAVICKAMEGRRRERMKSICTFRNVVNDTTSSHVGTTIEAHYGDYSTINTCNEETWLINDKENKQKISALTFTVNGETFEMMLVEAGTFILGPTAPLCIPGKPQIIYSNYYIGKTPVTQGLWRAVMGNNPSHFKGNDLPVECVSWTDCQIFISKLNNLTRKNFRLPTEAEWEFAAKGGKNSRGYEYSGSNNIDDVAWYYINSNNHTNIVATKKANELGIYDMSGNVDEFCCDWYENHLGRVYRGGCWNTMDGTCSVRFRSYHNPDYKCYCLGFRLALSE